MHQSVLLMEDLGTFPPAPSSLPHTMLLGCQCAGDLLRPRGWVGDRAAFLSAPPSCRFSLALRWTSHGKINMLCVFSLLSSAAFLTPSTVFFLPVSIFSQCLSKQTLCRLLCSSLNGRSVYQGRFSYRACVTFSVSHHLMHEGSASSSFLLADLYSAPPPDLL